MKVDYVLILAAGFGRRMGPLGEVLPKPLWPMFESTLLEQQINYVKRFSPQKIFINTHHQGDLIKEYCREKQFENIHIVQEKDILGSGGAIHNLMRVIGPKKGKLLTINADAFFDCNWDEMSVDGGDYHYLFSLEDHWGKYNRLRTQDGTLMKIVPPAELEQSSITYSGVGLINLELLSHCPGNTSFFESVCVPGQGNVKIVSPDVYDYIDFGELDIYRESIQLIYRCALGEKEETPLISFIKNNSINFSKIDKTIRSYNSPVKGCLNLTNGKDGEEGKIIINMGERKYLI